MDYNLTEKQAEGLKICIDRYKKKEPYSIISGYAGTGKSYLVNAIVNALGLEEYQVAYASYTGKAALVLRKQGKNAITLHRLLYDFYHSNGRLIVKPKPFLNPNLKLVVIDEISMCPKFLWDLLMSHHIYVIGLGDPFQLPAIGDDLKLLDKPHIFLDKIMRQALDNDIIKYSLDLREGKNLYAGIRGKNIRTYKKTEFVPEMLTWADQILCGKNTTRRRLNNEMRKCLGKEGLLQDGDKLICLHNYWDCATSTENDALVNGTIGYVSNININDDLKYICAKFSLDEGDTFGFLNMDYQLLKTGLPSVKKNAFGGIIKKNEKEFDYGYAITVHKAQGSQFNKALVYNERLMDEENHNRWLYTAITRAIDKVVVLL